MAVDVRDLNALRRRVREIWTAEGDRPRAIVHLSDEDGDREAVGGAFRTIAAEMGLRHLRFDLADGLGDAHREQLRRRGDRIVVVTSVDGVPADARSSLEDELRAGARTLPVCVAFVPADRIPALRRAWDSMGSRAPAPDAGGDPDAASPRRGG